MFTMRLSYYLVFLLLRSSLITSQRIHLGQHLLDSEQHTHTSPKQNTSTLEIISLAHASNSFFDQGSNNQNDPSRRDLLVTTKWPLWNNLNYYHGSKFNIKVYIPATVFDREERILIEKSIKVLQRKAKVIKVKFIKEKPTDRTPYIHFDANDNGCYSTIGLYKDAVSPEGQKINLQKSYCVVKRTIQHEFLHAMGLFHEHSRSDRDKYVQIQWQNIMTSAYDNFKIVDDADTLGVPYDLESVMHYGHYASLSKTLWSNNPRPETIKTVDPGMSIGDRDQASSHDILRLRLLYQCKSGPRQWSEYKNLKCSLDCRCWKNAKGCGKDHNLCQGSLICSKNKCISNKSGVEIDKPNIKTMVKYLSGIPTYYYVNGFVFDIQAKWKHITIQNFLVSLNEKAGALYNLEIYTKAGTFVGHVGTNYNKSQWVNIGNVSVKELGDKQRHQPRVLPINEPQFIKKKTKRAFYIRISDPDVNAFITPEGQNFDSQWMSNGHMDINEGCALGYNSRDMRWCQNGKSYNFIGGIDYIADK